MELNLDAVNTPARAAASVIVLRDTAGGMQTFLLKRHGASSVLAGAHVFPGGKVDPQDDDSGTHALLDQSPSALASRLNEPGLAPMTAAGLFVAAIREVFEECGVLFAHGGRTKHAQALAGKLLEPHPFGQALSSLSLRLDTTSLQPWSRWITPRVPSVMNQRFDTRFFIAAMPDGQHACHDDVETTDGIWLRPRDALQHYWDGAIALAPPQIMTLAHLSHYRSVGQVMAASLRQRPAHIAPEPFEDESGIRVTCYPGDPQHSVPERCMPGPTRLLFRNRRFEPPGGFDALFLPAPDGQCQPTQTE
ncbi:MAG TPA: NUDIX hydrolase [Burkholderiaceae bacterium]|nr:NUDIX hydrolase [Burkholderiaceae bacterium]